MRAKKQLKGDETVKLNNRYEVLTEKNNENSVQSDTDEESETVSGKKPDKIKTKKPPPVVVHGNIQSHEQFMKSLKDLLHSDFYIKYHGEFTEVFTKTREQNALLKAILLDKNISFHTYTDKIEKRKNFVIKGLHGTTDIDGIKLEIEEHGFKVASVNLMRNTRQTKHIVVILGNTQIKEI